MSLIIPDPRLEAPELLYPGRKPVGPVKIGWSLPFASNLTCFYVMQPSGDRVLDIARGFHMPKTTTGTGDWKRDGFQFFNDRFSKNDPAAPNIGDDFTAVVDLTVFIPQSGDAVMFAMRDAGNSNVNLSLDINNSSQFVLTHRRDVAPNWRGITSVQTINDSVRRTVVVRRKNTEDPTMWMNGVQVAATVGGTWSSGTAEPATSTALGGMPYTTGFHIRDVLVRSLYLMNVAHPDPAALSRDPYQFLVPA